VPEVHAIMTDSRSLQLPVTMLSGAAFLCLYTASKMPVNCPQGTMAVPNFIPGSHKYLTAQQQCIPALFLWHDFL